jgi:hypothetical protein
MAAWLCNNTYLDHNGTTIVSRPMQGQIPTEQDTTMSDAAIYGIRESNVSAVEQRRRPSKRSFDDVPEPDRLTSDSESENDVLLFDSLPEKRDLLDEEHPFQILVPNLVDSGLRAWKEGKAIAAASSSPSKRPAFSPLKLGPISMPFRQNKCSQTDHHWQQDTDGGEDAAFSCTAETDQSDVDILVVRSKTKDPPRSSLLACPFYRLDPIRYHSCMWELELPDTRTTKQHLIVDHRLREHCPICYAVFESAAARDQHIVARSCSEKEAPEGIQLGVSEEQVEKLAEWYDSAYYKARSRAHSRSRGSKHRNKSRKTGKTTTTYPRKLREKDKWFRIWDILFPTIPHPESPYLSAPREREILAMRRFWQKTGPEIMAGALEERDLLQWQDLREEAALAALHASVFKGMVERSIRSEDPA